MSRNFGLVDYKVQEAEFFLLEMRRVGKKLNFDAVQFHASAFVSAARSITFAMQASIRELPGFKEWYSERQALLRADPLCKFFHDFRTVTQHIGENVVSGGRHDGSGTHYYFVPCPDLPSVPQKDVITACEEYFRTILVLVYDCYIAFGPAIDGLQRYTEEYFASKGLGIEDAEEELGYPRGWTDIGDPASTPWRWEFLRRQVDGCLVEGQFDEWLDRKLPRPDALPPYQPGRRTDGCRKAEEDQDG
ncbi:MAG: hypothetical protein BGO50_12250 [Rhodanobacter sp. 67-28]|nr:MAG: hypothetical protein BGO50_12250 [Rhodanobacter sp. 67-28]